MTIWISPINYNIERLQALELVSRNPDLGESFFRAQPSLYKALVYCYGKRLVRLPRGTLELTARGREVLERWRVSRFARAERRLIRVD
jgi:hypothetical protein